MKKCKLTLEESNCGKNLCCMFCPDNESCTISCEEQDENCPDLIVEETELEIIQSAVPEVIKVITEISVQKKKIEEQEKIMKQKLIEAMEEHGIKKFENEFVTFTYVAPTTRATMDKKLFEKEHPEINLKDYDKISNVSASVRIKVK